MPFTFNPFTGTFDYYVIGSIAVIAAMLLLENGSHILLEDGSKILLEG